MSTDFITDPGIPFRAFRGFDHFGIRAVAQADGSLVLTDGITEVVVCAESGNDAPDRISPRSPKSDDLSVNRRA